MDRVWSRLARGAGALLVASAMLVIFVPAVASAGGTPGTSGDPRATAFPGNITACPKGTTKLLVVNNPSNASGGGVTATISGANRQFLTLTFDPSLTGAVVDAFVKGSNDYNEYVITVGTDTSNLLHSPYNASGNFPTVSHYLVCEASPPPVGPPNVVKWSVAFGYADSYRPTVSFNGPITPTPWENSPNTIFRGCDDLTQCPTDSTGTTVVYDSGAIMITNTGNVAFTLTPGTVTIGPSCTYNPWGNLSPITVPVGDNLILTQTGLLGPNQDCPNGEPVIPSNGVYNFDTSESNGAETASGALTCVNDNLDPVFNYTVSGVPGMQSTTDTGQILNTGGVDFGDCGPAGPGLNNETTQWTPAGP